MRKLVWFVLSAHLSFAQATNADYRNLSAITPCFDSSVIQISSDAVNFITVEEIYKLINNKFSAYKIEFLENCSPHDYPYPWFVHIHIQAKSAKNGILAYQIILNIYDRGILPGWQSIYSISTFGIEPDPQRLFLIMTKTSVSELIDKLAADYAKANP